MAAKRLFRAFRGTKISDGEGGFIETSNTAIAFYGNWSDYENVISIKRVNVNEDIRVGDYIQVVR